MNCGLHAVSVGMPSEKIINFWMLWFLKTESEQILDFPQTPTRNLSDVTFYSHCSHWGGQLASLHDCNNLPETKQQVNAFARVHLSVCLSVCQRAWIWMRCCVLTDAWTWTNWLTFEPDPDYSPDAGTGLLSLISYALQHRILLRQENPTYRYWAAATRGFKMVLVTASRQNNFVGGTCDLSSALLVSHAISDHSSQWLWDKLLDGTTLRHTQTDSADTRCSTTSLACRVYQMEWILYSEQYW